MSCNSAGRCAQSVGTHLSAALSAATDGRSVVAGGGQKRSPAVGLRHGAAQRSVTMTDCLSVAATFRDLRYFECRRLDNNMPSRRRYSFDD